MHFKPEESEAQRGQVAAEFLQRQDGTGAHVSGASEPLLFLLWYSTLCQRSVLRGQVFPTAIKQRLQVQGKKSTATSEVTGLLPPARSWGRVSILRKTVAQGRASSEPGSPKGGDKWRGGEAWAATLSQGHKVTGLVNSNDRQGARWEQPVKNGLFNFRMVEIHHS